MTKKLTLVAAVFAFILASCGSTKSVAKKEVDPYLGAWEVVIEETPQGDVAATMNITKNEDGSYSGNLESDMGAMDLKDLKIEKGALSSKFEVQGMDFEFTGTFLQESFKGMVSGMGSFFTANGKKKQQ